jgi:hypothetical protein
MEIGDDSKFCFCSESLNLGGSDYRLERLSITKYDSSYNNNNNMFRGFKCYEDIWRE